MLEPIYTDWWPESWGPCARGGATGLFIGNIAGIPAFLAVLAHSELHAPLWVGWVGLVWMATSAATMLRLSRRRLMAERDRALAARPARHAAEQAVLDEWVAECRRYLGKEVKS